MPAYFVYSIVRSFKGFHCGVAGEKASQDDSGSFGAYLAATALWGAIATRMEATTDYANGLCDFKIKLVIHPLLKAGLRLVAFINSSEIVCCFE